MARGDHDTAAAADFYSRALAEDPSNELILEQAFLLETACCRLGSRRRARSRAVKVERRIASRSFLLGLRRVQARRLQEADEHFAAARQGPIADLTSILARAWCSRRTARTDQRSPPSIR